MKGPEERDGASSRECHDHLVGDGMRIKKTINRDKLWIEGDGCRVTLATNSGSLHVTGDGCRVRITRNLGSVEYNGDGGRIILGPESINNERVKYRGDGGVIEFEGRKDEKRKSEEREKEKKEKTKEKVKTKTTTTRQSVEKDGRVVITKIVTTKDNEGRNNSRVKTTVNLGVPMGNVCVKKI